MQMAGGSLLNCNSSCLSVIQLEMDDSPALFLCTTILPLSELVMIIREQLYRYGGISLYEYLDIAMGV